MNVKTAWCWQEERVSFVTLGLLWPVNHSEVLQDLRMYIFTSFTRLVFILFMMSLVLTGKYEAKFSRLLCPMHPVWAVWVGVDVVTGRPLGSHCRICHELASCYSHKSSAPEGSCFTASNLNLPTTFYVQPHVCHGVNIECLYTLGEGEYPGVSTGHKVKPQISATAMDRGTQNLFHLWTLQT